jgi:hypothetical protein
MLWIKKYKVLIIIVCILAALISLDLYIGHIQIKKLDDMIAQKKRNELLAYYLERTSVEEISYTGKGDLYQLQLRYENVRPDEEMWIMIHTVKVFIQVGTLWRELSVNDMRMKRGDYNVERLKDPLTMTVIFDLSSKNFQELMPGYYHMKIGSLSYISAEAVSKEDIVEKYEDVFLYLSTAKKPGHVKTLLR